MNGDQTELVGIFGGSFNPPHMAHVLACQFALSAWPLSRIIVIPNYMHPLDKALVSYEHRLRMTQLAFEHLQKWIEVSTLEHDLGGISYSIDTVRELMQRYPSAAFRLIVGSDILREIHRWKEHEELARCAPLLVIPRLEPTAEISNNHLLPAVSSTWLRTALERNEDTGLALPYKVREYIDEHGLYATT